MPYNPGINNESSRYIFEGASRGFSRLGQLGLGMAIPEAGKGATLTDRLKSGFTSAGIGFDEMNRQKDQADKEAKMEKRLFDSYITQGEALGFNKDKLHTMSLGELQGVVDGEKLKRSMEGVKAAIADHMSAMDARKSAQEAAVKQAGAQAGFFRDVNNLVGQSKPMPVDYDGVQPPPKFTLTDAYLQAAAGNPGAVSPEKLLSLIKESGVNFEPEAKTVPITLGDGTVIEMPTMKTSKGTAQAFPELVKGNPKYEKPESNKGQITDRDAFKQMATAHLAYVQNAGKALTEAQRTYWQQQADAEAQKMNEALAGGKAQAVPAAEAAKPTAQPAAAPTSKPQEPPKITTKEEFAKLSSGAEYIGTDGKKYRKP